MAFLTVEALEFIIENIITFLQFLNKQIYATLLFMSDFHHVDVLESVVVAVDVVLVRALADVEHTHILTVDVEHGRVTCLPVKVNVAAHRALDNEVAEVEVAEIVATVSKRE